MEGKSRVITVKSLEMKSAIRSGVDFEQIRYGAVWRVTQNKIEQSANNKRGLLVQFWEYVSKATTMSIV